jgi:hypothetical protein
MAKEVEVGWLRNGKIGNLFLPENKVLGDYRIKTSPGLFTFKCTAFRSPEMSVKGVNDNGKKSIAVDVETNPEPLSEFEFVYSGESFNMSHSHNFGEPRGVVGMLKSFFDKGVLGVGGNTILAVMESMDELFTTGQTSIKTDWNAFGALDLAKSYQGTNAPEVKISFVLFTTDDPFYDVVLPATFLTYMSYPRLSKTKDEIEEMLSVLVGFLQGKAGNSSTNQPKQSNDKTFYGKLKDAAPDKWRYRLGYAPPTWVISSSNGMYHLNNASLRNVDVTYHGPWLPSSIVVTNDQINSALNGIGNLGNQKLAIGQQNSSKASQTFKTNTPYNNANSKQGQNVNVRGFPSWAEVTLTFASNFEQIFGEEWMLSMVAGSSHYSKVFADVSNEYTESRNDNGTQMVSISTPAPTPTPAPTGS